MSKELGFTFEFDVPEEFADAVEDFMEQLAMDGVTDIDEIERRVLAFIEEKSMDDPYALDDGLD